MYHSIMYLYILFFKTSKYIILEYIQSSSISLYFGTVEYAPSVKKKANINMYGILPRTTNLNMLLSRFVVLENVSFILRLVFFKDGGSILEENSLHHHSKANTTLSNICVLLSAHLESLACPNGPTCLCPCIFCPTSCRPMAWHVAPSTANPL